MQIITDRPQAPTSSPYLERKDADGSQILYREGEPADTLHLVAAGHLAIDLAKGNGERLRVRRTMTQ